MIMRIHAIDQAGNRIEVPHQEVTIKCTTGDAEHLAGDTYEVSIDQAVTITVVMYSGIDGSSTVL